MQAQRSLYPNVVSIGYPLLQGNGPMFVASALYLLAWTCNEHWEGPKAVEGSLVLTVHGVVPLFTLVCVRSEVI